jgi:hypothetical protein
MSEMNAGQNAHTQDRFLMVALFSLCISLNEALARQHWNSHSVLSQGYVILRCSICSRFSASIYPCAASCPGRVLALSLSADCSARYSGQLSPVESQPHRLVAECGATKACTSLPRDPDRPALGATVCCPT